MSIVFGEKSELELENFSRGKTIFVFKNLEKAFKDGQACLYNENKILLASNREDILFELSTRVWKYFAVNYFYEILSNKKLGKILMEIP